MDTPADEKGWRWCLKHLLVPAVLSIVAAVGAIVATNIQGRHDLQKELELKTDLVSRMSSAATEAVFQSQAVADRSVTRGAPIPADAFQAAYDGNLRQWKVASAEIDASLHAYFGVDVSACWEAYSEAVTGYLRLNADPSATRTAGLLALKAFADKPPCGLAAADVPERDWDVLGSGLNTTDKTFGDIPADTRLAFLNAYTALGDAILRLGKPLVGRVVSDHARGF